MRINIYLSNSDLQGVDDYCDRNGLKRSGFFVLAARKLIDKELSEPRTQPAPFPEPLKEKIDSEIKTVLKKVKEKQEIKGIKLCKQGRMPGLCEYGCK